MFLSRTKAREDDELVKNKENQNSMAKRAWGLTHNLGNRLLPTLLAMTLDQEKKIIETGKSSSY